MGIELQQLEKQKRKTHPQKENKTGKTSDLIALLNKDIQLFGKKLKDKKKEKFYSELAILLSSGLDIKSSLDIVVDEQTKEADKKIFRDISNSVLGGGGLSEALVESGYFSPYEYYSIKIGEESGKLNNVLEDLATFYDKKIKQKRQLVNAFSYPILVLITAFAAVFFMMNYMVPMFVDVFSRFGGELPAITRFIVRMSDFFSNNNLLFFSLTVAIVFMILLLRKNNRFRNVSSKLLLGIPLLGDIVKKIYLERFCQSMALLTVSKTPMLQAIQLVKKMISFYPFEKALVIIENDVLHGKLLYESMQQFKLFDKRFVSLIKVGEEVNQLELIFEKLDRQFAEELDHRISMISSLLEPFLIIFVGVIVGIVLIAMYLPMFQLSTSVF